MPHKCGGNFPSASIHSPNEVAAPPLQLHITTAVIKSSARCGSSPLASCRAVCRGACDRHNGSSSFLGVPSSPNLSRVPVAMMDASSLLVPKEILANSPSLEDGVSREDEIKHRVFGGELIQEAGILLRLPQGAMATGQTLFQRFFYRKSFKKFNSFQGETLLCSIRLRSQRLNSHASRHGMPVSGRQD